MPITHDAFRRKQGVKAVFSKVQMPPLLRQRHAAHWVVIMRFSDCFISFHLALGAI